MYFCARFRVKKVVLFLLIMATIFLGCWGEWPSAIRASNEIELTPELVSTLEPKLSSPRLTGQLEIHDKLVYGKGDYLRVDGKSRRCLVLLLDKYGKFFVRLFDLPESQLKSGTARGLVYFTGVFAKVERTDSGPVEISITYAFVSSKPDLFFTAQAQAFTSRVEAQKLKNRELLATTGSSKEVEASKPVATIESRPSAEPADVPADTDSGRPMLIRRGSPPNESSPASAPSVVEHPGSKQAPAAAAENEQDNVIYRRPKTDTAAIGASPNRKAPAVNRSNVRLPAEYQQDREIEGMVLIPAGYVTMGTDDPGDSEKPVHRVMVGAFYLDKSEVTNSEYQKFCLATGRPTPVAWKDGKYLPGQERHPVVQLSWQDAVAYSRWAGKRLPTEAEWERAAKGPNATRYAYGNSYDPAKENTSSSGTKPVGSFLANGFGLYDMTGNVSEWTSTLFMPYPYKFDDGREDSQAIGPRVLRGGNYTSGDKDSRCLRRSSLAPEKSAPTLGFRCARDAA